MYSSITQPYIRSFPLSRLQWVYNILDKKVSGLSSGTCGLQPVHGVISSTGSAGPT